jgi:uncharacterized membrane-anchored protein
MTYKEKILYSNRQLIKIKQSIIVLGCVMTLLLSLFLTIGKNNKIVGVITLVLFLIVSIMFIIFWVAVPRTKKYILQLIEENERRGE